jgi:glutaredoxin
MKIDLYVANNCTACIRAENQLNAFISSRKNLAMSVTNIKKTVKNVPIVPALFVDEILFAYGDFDLERLETYINRKN